MKDERNISFSRIEITGEHHYTRSDDILQPILSLGITNVFTSQNINIIQDQIKHLPWIKQVTISKKLPNELNIHLVEYVPIACWNNQYMVDINCNLFTMPDNRINKHSLLLLYGPNGSEKEVLHKYLDMVQILKKGHLFLKEATMTTYQSWHLTLTNGIKLNLGRWNTIKRLICFVALYPVLIYQSQNDGKQINYVDLRYDSGAAVSWIPITHCIKN